MKEAMPQLRPEVLFSGSGWPLRRKLKPASPACGRQAVGRAAPLGDEKKGGYPQNGPLSTKPAGYPPSDDSLFKGSEGRPLRINCILNGGVLKEQGGEE